MCSSILFFRGGEELTLSGKEGWEKGEEEAPLTFEQLFLKVRSKCHPN